MKTLELHTSSNSVVFQSDFSILYAGLVVGLSWIRICTNSADVYK